MEMMAQHVQPQHAALQSMFVMDSDRWSMLCLSLSCCRPPSVSWLYTVPVKGSLQVRCTTEFRHSCHLSLVTGHSGGGGGGGAMRIPDTHSHMVSLQLVGS